MSTAGWHAVAHGHIFELTLVWGDDMTPSKMQKFAYVALLVLMTGVASGLLGGL